MNSPESLLGPSQSEMLLDFYATQKGSLQSHVFAIIWQAIFQLCN